MTDTQSNDDQGKFEEEASLLLQASSWTTKDYQLTVLFVLISFGDGVEIYLPGVITQVVSCELGVSSLKEGLLGIILYATIAATVLIARLLVSCCGNRKLIISSLYISIISSVVCAVVPGYNTLLVARAMIGVSVGLNACVIGVFFAENVSTPKAFAIGTSVSSVTVPLGAGWGSILCYSMMGALGWRVFVVAVSVPLFIPPLILLHFFLDYPMDSSTNVRRETQSTDAVEVPHAWNRNLKTCVMNFFCCIQGYGGILLLPALLRADNEEGNYLSGENCSSAVQGAQFLILAAVHGGTNLVGRLAGALLHGRIRFRILQPIIALAITLCYGLLLLSPGIVATSVLMGVSKMLYSMSIVEIVLMVFDPVYNGSSNLETFAACNYVAAFTGGIVGTALAVFVTPYNAVICIFVLSWGYVGAACSITDRD